MSYRALKRLLGETSLERKCRFLFGAFILLLITGSFWLYGHQTEDLAYEQITTTCRLLVNPIVQRKHAEKGVQDALTNYQAKWEDHFPEQLTGYTVGIIKPGDGPDESIFREFESAGEDRMEINRLIQSKGENHYYAAVRAARSCVECHNRLAGENSRAKRGEDEHATPKLRAAELTEGDLMAVVHIKMQTSAIESGMHLNRAILISTALVTSLLIMIGSYVIVRYVIVKPVKHLKEVSDAISAGELNVRSEIQTGDEFEDLSHAFNRMLRNLVSMQERLKKANTGLDRKVDELAQANMALYESNRLKSDFLATMSHELRTPLNSILGFSEVLLSGNSLSDKQQRWVRNIQTSGDRLLNLINDILDLAKIEAGKMQLRLEDFSVHDVCESVVNMFRPLAEKKNIDLRSQVDPGIPTVRQDVVKFQQILQNLLSNAIKFT